MSQKPTNEALERAFRIGLVGMALVASSIAWVFVQPDGMIGIAESLAFFGMLTIMAAAWKAAEATMGSEDDR